MSTQSQNELVDIIDNNNQVLFQETKQKAHELGLLHRTVIAEVINSKGEWLLVQQASDKQDAGQFVSPMGGHVQAGESEEEALVRETKEELGIENFEYKRVGQKVFNRFFNNHQENHLFIVYEIYSNTEPTLNHESVSFKRFLPHEIKQLTANNSPLLGEAFRFVINSFYC
jgi:8-oxo-dGTP pyrophosphatase MutT (NUDIX family)